MSRLITTVFLLSLILAVTAGADQEILKDSKQELDRIKQQLTDTRRKVDSLNQLKDDLQKTISGYSERVNRNRKVIDQTERKLNSVRSELDKNKGLLDETETRLKQKRRSYVGLLVDFYRRRKSETLFEKWDFASVMDQSRRVHYLASISGYTKREIARVDDSIQVISQQVDSLEQTGSSLKKLRTEKQAKVNLDLTLREKEETSLGDVRRQSNIMQERMEALSEAARRMEEIVAELERTQQKRRREEGERPRYQAGKFAQLKGHLRSPIKGKIVSSFGWKKNKITNLSSFSPGIDIRPLTGHKEVRVCAPGRVVYVGQLRGYNNFVIVEHDDGYFTTYAGLKTVSRELDEVVDAGDKIGTLTGDGNFHFEIRQGREHLDPVMWLNIDEF
jgi:septal ring factor EnvC (AmiA/AmiB activator)